VRILLAHNSTYYPSTGGGDKSNRLLMEGLAARGHQVRVATRVETFGPEGHQRLIEELRKRGIEPDTSDGQMARFELHGVDVLTLSLSPHLRPFFQAQIDEFDPDIIVTSTDDPGQLLFGLAVKAPRARVVYLVRATIAVPFGPDSSMVSATKTESLKRADGVVGVSHYVANYVREWSGLDAVHVPISLLEPGSEFPQLGRWDNPYVSMVNPCAVKGISIFLQIADLMPEVQFAAVPLWGTQAAELEELRLRPNVHLIGPYDNMDDLLTQTSIMLVPSVWAEARSRVVLESMTRGIPVLASDVGGLHEAKLGVPYLVRVRPIVRYKPTLDSNMVPIADVPPQDPGPWVEILTGLLHSRSRWEELARASRKAALQYAENLTAEPFEKYLLDLLRKPKRAHAPQPVKPALTEDKRRLLALRLKQRASGARTESSSWFSGVDTEAEDAGRPRLRLFCFPWAGGGTLAYRTWREPLASTVHVVPVRLPGRESRASELPIERMDALVAQLLEAIRPYVSTPFAFFGHSMGAGIAFELTRALRRAGLPLPRSLHVSGARAPQYRLNYKPGPEPAMRDFIEELRRLEGFPPSTLNNPELMKLALPSLLSDSRLYRNYSYSEEDPLNVPIAAYGGDADPNVTAEHLEAWREQTSSSFQRYEFPGGHFYLESARSLLLKTLREALTTSTGALPGVAG
jgi:surfactin synthase thioesterase subunit/glycosyltransferase involved in cell wall biosynthesis